MKPRKHRAVGAAFLLIGACWSNVSIAQVPCMAPGCYGSCVHQKGLEVGCAPRRITYGYYPTLWRRWPTGSVAQTPTPATEPLPPTTQPTTPTDELPAPGDDTGPTLTPDSPNEPTIAPDQPMTTPGQPTIQPDDPTQGPAAPGIETPTLPPANEPDTMLPFADEPPAPPTDASRSPADVPSSSPAPPSLPSPSTDDPAPDLPGLEPQIQAPPTDDAPPVMPDDDPFKDDPVQPDSTLDSPAPEEPRRTTNSSTSESNAPSTPGRLHWRSAAVTPVRESASVTVAATAAKPPETMRVQPSAVADAQAGRRIPVTPSSPADVHAHADPASPEGPAIKRTAIRSRHAEPRRLPPVELAKGVNPLRRSLPAGREASVVATAAWSSDKPAPTLSVRPRRHNPLRDN